MASVVKERSTKRGPQYRVDFRDRNGKLYAIRGLDYRAAAESLRRKIERLEQLRRGGDIPTEDVLEWLEQVPLKWREKFVRAGLLDASRLLGSRRIWSHLLAFYRA